MPRLSVIIPTYRRPHILRKTLEHLARQTIASDLEVIVISDGPDSDTRRAVESFSTNYQLPTTNYFEIPKSHQGVARNKGVKEATGDHILFIGDDIFLSPDACEWHLQSTINNQQSAILGHTTWDPDLILTPVMRWLESSGWQFGYPMIARYAGKAIPASIQHSFSYTSHISLPRATALANPFREDVSLYGWEDMEWGKRLKDAGIPLIYEPRARAFHHHPMTIQQSLKRMETLGRSAVIMETIDSTLNIVPKGWKRWMYDVATYLPTMAAKHRRAFLSGIDHVE